MTPNAHAPCDDDDLCRRLESALTEAHDASVAAHEAAAEARRILQEIRRELRFPLVASTRLEADDGD